MTVTIVAPAVLGPRTCGLLSLLLLGACAPDTSVSAPGVDQPSPSISAPDEGVSRRGIGELSLKAITGTERGKGLSPSTSRTVVRKAGHRRWTLISDVEAAATRLVDGGEDRSVPSANAPLVRPQRPREWLRSDVSAVQVTEGVEPVNLHLTGAQVAAMPMSDQVTDYSPDLGMTVTVSMTRFSAADPSMEYALYNGTALLASMYVEYSADGVGGWNFSHSSGYAFQNGTIIYGGTINHDELVDQASSSPRHREQQNRVFIAAANRVWAYCSSVVVDLVSPKAAQAQGSCGYYMRGALIALGSMAFSALVDNPIGFFVGAANVINNTYEYAACKERGG